MYKKQFFKDNTILRTVLIKNQCLFLSNLAELVVKILKWGGGNAECGTTGLETRCVVPLKYSTAVLVRFSKQKQNPVRRYCHYVPGLSKVAVVVHVSCSSSFCFSAIYILELDDSTAMTITIFNL